MFIIPLGEALLCKSGMSQLSCSALLTLSASCCCLVIPSKFDFFSMVSVNCRAERGWWQSRQRVGAEREAVVLYVIAPFELWKPYKLTHGDEVAISTLFWSVKYAEPCWRAQCKIIRPNRVQGLALALLLPHHQFRTPTPNVTNLHFPSQPECLCMPHHRWLAWLPVTTP